MTRLNAELALADAIHKAIDAGLRKEIALAFVEAAFRIRRNH